MKERVRPSKSTIRKPARQFSKKMIAPKTLSVSGLEQCFKDSVSCFIYFSILSWFDVDDCEMNNMRNRIYLKKHCAPGENVAPCLAQNNDRATCEKTDGGGGKMCVFKSAELDCVYTSNDCVFASANSDCVFTAKPTDCIFKSSSKSCVFDGTKCAFELVFSFDW